MQSSFITQLICHLEHLPHIKDLPKKWWSINVVIGYLQGCILHTIIKNTPDSERLSLLDGMSIGLLHHSGSVLLQLLSRIRNRTKNIRSTISLNQWSDRCIGSIELFYSSIPLALLVLIIVLQIVPNGSLSPFVIIPTKVLENVASMVSPCAWFVAYDKKATMRGRSTYQIITRTISRLKVKVPCRHHFNPHTIWRELFPFLSGSCFFITIGCLRHSITTQLIDPPPHLNCSSKKALIWPPVNSPCISNISMIFLFFNLATIKHPSFQRGGSNDSESKQRTKEPHTYSNEQPRRSLSFDSKRS